MKVNIINTSIFVIFLTISSGCLNTNDQIPWGTEGELEMHIKLIDYSIYPGYNYLNFSVIRLNMSLMNIFDEVVYIENRFVFDINIDGIILDSSNNSFHINEYSGGRPKFGWEKPEKLYPGNVKYWDDYFELSIYNDEGQRGIMDNVLLSDNEEYTIKCWYEHEGNMVYSNEILFSPSEWEDV